MIARRKTEHGSGLGRVRLGRRGATFAWLHHLKRLLVPLRPTSRDPTKAFLASRLAASSGFRRLGSVISDSSLLVSAVGSGAGAVAAMSMAAICSSDR